MQVDLTVYDFFENVVLMLGWVLNNAFWKTLNETMIAAIPFLAVVVREWYLARREGEDEGNKGLLSLNRIEASLYAMILVYMFAAFPLVGVQFAPANVNQSQSDQCNVRVATGSGGSSGGGAALGGKSASMPLWWAMVHAVSTGLTNAGIAALPCEPDYQYVRTHLNNAAIQDPKLSREVANFQTACYGGARAKLFRDKGAISDTIAKDTDWIGSKYFMNTPGYYDSLRANGPVQGFAYQASRDSGRGTTPDQGGYPTCKQWWSASGNGLRSRLHDEIDTSTWQKFQAIFSGSNAEDYAIRSLLTNQHGGGLGNSGSATNSDAGYASSVGSMTGSVGGILGAFIGKIGAWGMKDALVRGMPMVQYLMMMAVVIAMPFVLVFSGYSFKVTGIVTFSYFGLTSLTFWFQLTTWLQNHLIDMVYNSQAGKLDMLAGLTSTYDQNILEIVQVSMMLVFPTFWMAMLGWTGAAVGSGIGDALKGGSGETKNAGKQGADKVKSTATKGKL